MNARCYAILAALFLAEGNLATAETLSPGMPSAVIGTYYNLWSPLGPTPNGFDFSIGFRFADGNQSTPRDIWIGKKSQMVLEVDSIAAVNLVVADSYLAEGMTRDEKAIHNTIAGIRKLLMRQSAFSGQTGIALIFERQKDLDALVQRVRQAGVDGETAAIIERLGNMAKEHIDVAAGKWNTEWYEVDPMGAVEKVSIAGELQPVRIQSVLRELLYDVGKVNPNFLRAEILFDRKKIR